MKRTRIILKKDGSIKATAEGYTGGQCIERQEFLEKIFGGLVDRELKSSYYEEEEKTTLLDSDGYPSGWCG